MLISIVRGFPPILATVVDNLFRVLATTLWFSATVTSTGCYMYGWV